MHGEHVSTRHPRANISFPLYPSPCLSVSSPIPAFLAPCRPLLRSTPACITDQHPQTAPQSLLAPAEPGSPSHPIPTIENKPRHNMPSRLLVCLFQCRRWPAKPAIPPPHLPRSFSLAPDWPVEASRGNRHRQPRPGFPKGFFPRACRWAQYYPPGPLCTIGRSPRSPLHYCTVRHIARFFSLLDVSKASSGNYF